MDFKQDLQQAVCEKYGTDFVNADPNLKVGFSRNAKERIFPLNGLRLLPEQGTTGWFIWGGEALSGAEDFFMPLHAKHLQVWCPDVLPYLELPPGWRFLIAPGYENVWFDEQLLNV